MAKKKGKNNANNAPDAAVDAVEQEAQAEAAVEEAGNGAQQEQDAPVENMDVEQLRAELNAAHAEISRLKAELAKSAERDSIAPKGSKPQDVQELQDKLQRLRKEQQEADAARDKAWKQLKAVVQEISSLANPDYLQSLQVKAHD